MPFKRIVTTRTIKPTRLAAMLVGLPALLAGCATVAPQRQGVWMMVTPRDPDIPPQAAPMPRPAPPRRVAPPTADNSYAPLPMPLPALKLAPKVAADSGDHVANPPMMPPPPLGKGGSRVGEGSSSRPTEKVEGRGPIIEGELAAGAGEEIGAGLAARAAVGAAAAGAEEFGVGEALGVLLRLAPFALLAF